MRRLQENGSLLIVALWALLVVGLLALGVSRGARFALKLAEYQWDEIRLAQGAKAGAALCAGLFREKDTIVTAFNQPWSSEPRFFKEHPIPDGSITVQCRDDGSRFGLEDEESKINLNSASSAELNRIFKGCPDCVSSVESVRLRSIPELLMLNGVTAEIYKRIRNSVTVYGAGRININTAGGGTLGFLGMKPSLVEKIVGFRNGPDGTMGTTDDRVFNNLAGVTAEIEKQRTLTNEEKLSLIELLNRGRFTVRSEILSGYFTVRLMNSRAVRRYRLVFETKGGKILFWQEE